MNTNFFTLAAVGSRSAAPSQRSPGVGRVRRVPEVLQIILLVEQILVVQQIIRAFGRDDLEDFWDAPNAPDAW